MNKLKPIFVFMIKNQEQVKSVRIIKTSATLSKYVKIYPQNEVKTFNNEEDAVKYIQENKFPLDMQKQQAYMKVSEARESLNSSQEVMKQYQRGKIEKDAPQLQQLKDDEVLKNFEKQSQTLYNYYSENQSLIEKAAKKIIADKFYHLMFDGASKNNPGPSGVGFAIYNEGSEQIYSSYMHTGFKTNNQAEYLALLYGLKSAQSIGIKYLKVYGDSQLVINQMNNVFRVKDRNIILYNGECKKLSLEFAHLNFKYIPREQNHVADALANQGVASYKKEKQTNEKEELKEGDNGNTDKKSQ